MVRNIKWQELIFSLAFSILSAIIKDVLVVLDLWKIVTSEGTNHADVLCENKLAFRFNCLGWCALYGCFFI